MIYGPADLFFLVLHSGVILFNLLGWMLPATRVANLLLLLATVASWLILGQFYGLGYCPLTDWHYQVLVSAGATGLPPSWIVHVIERFSGWRPPAFWADVATVTFLAAALMISARLNWLDYRRRKH